MMCAELQKVKELKLKELNKEIFVCNKCSFNEKTDTRQCDGIGKDYSVMFVCESPSTAGGAGKFNNQSNFNCTKADNLFNNYKKRYGLDECYTTDFVKCGVPNDKPDNEKIENCSKYAQQEIEIVTPKIIVAVGRIAYNLLNQYIYNIKVPIILIYHYSYIYRWCRNKPSKISEYENQFKEIAKKLAESASTIQ